MCCNDARMGMISSRQLVLSRTSSTGSQPRRSCGSKGMRIGESLEEVPAGNPEIGGSPRIHTRDIRDLRGESWQKSQKTRSNRFFRRALARRGPARLLDRGDGVTFGQAHETDQDPDRLDAAGLDHRFGPLGAVGPEASNAGQLPGGAALDPADLLRDDVCRLRAEPPGFLSDVNLQRFHPVVEDPHQPRVPADPDPSGEILRRRGVVGVFDFDVAVAMDHATLLAKRREGVCRQGQERGPLDFREMFADVSTCRPVHSCVGHGLFPVAAILVLFLQADEALASQGVFLDVVHAPLDLPLVSWHIRTCWQEHRAVMFAEGADLRVDLRVEPIRLLHGRLEVVQDKAPGHPAEMPEGVLQAAEEVLGGLAVDRLAVGLAGVAQDDAEDVGLAPLAIGADDRRARAEVDLGLLARPALHASKRQVVRLLEPMDEPADAVVAAGESVVGVQILVDPLCAEPEVTLPLNQLSPRLTTAGPTAAAGLRIGCRTGSRERQFWRALALVRAGGRFGWFCRALALVRAGGRVGWF